MKQNLFDGHVSHFGFMNVRHTHIWAMEQIEEMIAFWEEHKGKDHKKRQALSATAIFHNEAVKINEYASRLERMNDDSTTND